MSDAITKCKTCKTDWKDCDILNDGECASCLRVQLDTLAGLVDDVLFDPNWNPLNDKLEPIPGEQRYLLDHPVQEQHLFALRSWFVQYFYPGEQNE